MDFKNSRNFFVKFFATCFGLGYSPTFPGAAGVAFGAAIAYLIHPLPFYIKILITLALIVFAVPLSTKAEELFQKKDCKKIIIDEVVGILIATIWFTNLSVIMFIAILLIYGLFDVIKVYPANISERFYGGWGIVIDDIIAGAYTALIIFLLLKFV
jgi:phosphatidylglycerophosphatase A